MDAGFLNSVVNHPEVRPWLGGAEPIDLTPALSDPRNVALVSDHGGFFLEWREPGLYEVHTQFLPSGRGRHAFEAVWEAMRYMFVETDCTRLLTRVPVFNRRTLAFTAAIGWRKLFERKAAWPMPNGQMSDVHYYAFDFEDWRARDRTLTAHGQWFHDRLEIAKKDVGSLLPVHDEDDAHDRAVGASVLMIRAGNAKKAVWLYNRWANHAGYASIRMIGDTPTIVDVVDAIVQMRDGDMEVMLCR
jgi:hypothetical protein